MSKKSKKKKILKKFLYEGYVRIKKKKLKKIGMHEIDMQKYIKKHAPNRTPTLYKYDDNISYIYDKKEIEIHMIKDVSSYIEKIKGYEEKNLFFRGHPDSNYLLQPSIVRDVEERKKEREMIDELERLCPEELYDLKTILDKLAEMQHYSLPTRLLDISSNALVALFFACQELKKDGEVVILQGKDSSASGERKKANVCYVHSDKVSLLTGISQMNYTDQLLLYYVTDFFNDFVKDRNNDRDFWYGKISDIIYEVYNKKYSFDQIENSILDTSIDLSINQLRELINKRCADKTKVVEVNRLEDFNKIDIVKRLYRQVLREKPYFEKRIVSEDICNVLLVKPPMLNSRIIKQAGAFLLVGAMSKNGDDIINDLNECRFSKAGKKPILVIPANCKEDILKELELCNLHDGTIYPEIEKVAKYVRKTIGHRK